jgi:hypothetical protein
MRRVLLIFVIATIVLGSGAVIMVDDTVAQDELPPKLYSIRVTTIGETWFEVAWETNEPAKGGVEWGLKKGYGNVSNEFEGFVTDHLLNVTGLEKGTEYHFRVFAEDLNGNEAVSGDFIVGTYPLGEDEGGVSLGTWLIIIAIVVVPIVYLLFLRPRD